MNRLRHGITLLALCSLLSVAGAQEHKPASTLRLTLDLADGSRVTGLPSITSINVQTPYATMNIALKQIKSVAIGNDHETAVVELTNGDKATGAINLGSLKLQTIFGNVSVEIQHVTTITINAEKQ